MILWLYTRLEGSPVINTCIDDTPPIAIFVRTFQANPHYFLNLRMNPPFIRFDVAIQRVFNPTTPSGAFTEKALYGRLHIR